MGILSPLHFHVNFKISSPISTINLLRFWMTHCFPWLLALFSEISCSLATSQKGLEKYHIEQISQPLLGPRAFLTFRTSHYLLAQTGNPFTCTGLELCGPAGYGWACLCIWWLSLYGLACDRLSWSARLWFMHLSLSSRLARKCPQAVVEKHNTFF